MELRLNFLIKVSLIEKNKKLQKKQHGRVYFCVYGTAFSMLIQQKLPPPVLLFSDFAGWADLTKSSLLQSYFSGFLPAGLSLLFECTEELSQ